MIQHTTQAAAYEGARVGIVPGATEEQISAQVGFILSSVGVDNFTIDVEHSDPEDSLPRVRVRVDVPYTETTVGGVLFGPNTTFSGETELGQEAL